MISVGKGRLFLRDLDSTLYHIPSRDLKIGYMTGNRRLEDMVQWEETVVTLITNKIAKELLEAFIDEED